MKRFILRGVITALLLLSALSLLRDVLPDGLFVIRNFFGIIAGETALPPLKGTSIVTLFAMPVLFIGLISTIPRKDGSYSDDEEEK